MLHPAAPAKIGMPVFFIDEWILPEQAGENLEGVWSNSPAGYGGGVLVGVRMIYDNHGIGRRIMVPVFPDSELGNRQGEKIGGDRITDGIVKSPGAVTIAESISQIAVGCAEESGIARDDDINRIGFVIGAVFAGPPGTGHIWFRQGINSRHAATVSKKEPLIKSGSGGAVISDGKRKGFAALIGAFKTHGNGHPRMKIIKAGAILQINIINGQGGVKIKHNSIKIIDQRFGSGPDIAVNGRIGRRDSQLYPIEFDIEIGLGMGVGDIAELFLNGAGAVKGSRFCLRHDAVHLGRGHILNVR